MSKATATQYYTNKSNANRAGKKQHGEGNYLIETTQLGLKVVLIEKESPIVEQIKDAQKQADKVANNAVSSINRESTIKRPCFVVWDMADNMPGARRKDVVEACVQAGVAYYTARTQYQLWLQTSKASKASK